MGANSGQPLAPQFRRKHFSKEWASQASTNTYVILGSVWDKTGFISCTMQIWNTGSSNAIDFKILGSLNGTDYDIEVYTGTTISKSDYILLNLNSILDDCYIPYLQIQIKSTVTDSHSTVEAYGVVL